MWVIVSILMFVVFLYLLDKSEECSSCGSKDRRVKVVSYTFKTTYCKQCKNVIDINYK